MVVPLGRRLGEREGETMKGEMLPIFVMSSRKEAPLILLVEKEGWAIAVRAGKEEQLTMACGEGGGRVGVRGRLPWRPPWGAKEKGE